MEERGFDCFVAKKCCRVAHFEEEEEEISFPVEIFKRVLLIYLVGSKIRGSIDTPYYEGSTAFGILVAGYIYICIYTCGNYVLKYKFIPLILVIVQLCSRVFLLRRKWTALRRTYFSLLNLSLG